MHLYITMAYKRFLSRLLISVSIIAVFSFVVADDPIDTIQRQLAKWTDEHPVEKVYLHLDKPYYAAGDDIWFKAYVTIGSYHQLSAMSGVLNVDLLNDRNRVERSIKLQLSNGTAAGDFALPDTLSGGNYRIRAYTNYMRNAGAEYFFDQSVAIVAGVSSKAPKTVSAAVRATYSKFANKPDVQFFPEGGTLVDNITTQIAFKTVGMNGLGMDVRGVITDSKGNPAGSFTSTHLGMGKFIFTPLPGETYTAKVTNSAGTETTVQLPRSATQGYVLNVTDADADNLLITISAGKATANANQIVSLIGQSAGKVYYAGKSSAGKSVFTSRIAKSKFPTGIAQFTLFTSTGEPLNERLVFIQRPDVLKLNLSSPGQTYAPQQKVTLGLAATSAEKPAVGSFSVSVTDETKVPVNENTENNIITSLLLTSDLRGYVEQPAYYFNNPTDKTRSDLDALMLTQGYRRFEWKQVMRGSTAVPVYRAEKSLQISGTITTSNGKPVVGGKVQVIDIDDIATTLDTLTDGRGRFSFTNLAFADSIRLIVQARNAKNKKDVIIKLDSIGTPSNLNYKNQPDLAVSIADSLSTYTQNSKAYYAMQRRYGLGNHVISLQEVIIREKKLAVKNSANLNGPGNADQIILAKDLRYMGCIRIGDCLQGRLVGVIFRNGIPYSTRGYGQMQVIIDGLYVDGDFINSINFNDVQAIEVLRNVGLASIYGSRANNGVIIITTKRGDDREEYNGPIAGRGIQPYNPKGYFKARAFYSPQYDQPKVVKQVADLRTTIYWNPSLITNAEGKTSFSYFNAGSRGTYRVVVEGIDADGNIGRQVYRYRVQ